MKKKTDKTRLLHRIIEDTFWMARRYADGRRTYAPHMVRDAYKILKKHFPEINIRSDIVIAESNGTSDDYLKDCNA